MIADPILKLNELHCYRELGERVTANVDQPTVYLILDPSLQIGRNRINCTVHDHTGHWHWGSLLFLVEQATNRQGSH
jgi:hypothetical protein